jgi:hypothetical protein
MAQHVDIALVRRSVSIEQILSHYDLLETLIRKSDNTFVGPCPIHQGTNKTQFSVSLSKNAFHCFGDCKGDPDLHNGGGNMFDLVRKMEQIDIPDDPDYRKATRKAALLVADWFGIGTQRKPWASSHHAPTPPVKPLVSPPAQATPPAPATAKEPLVNTPLTFTFPHLDHLQQFPPCPKDPIRPMPEGSPGASFGSQKPCVTLPSKREAKRGAIPCNVGFPFG